MNCTLNERSIICAWLTGISILLYFPILVAGPFELHALQALHHGATNKLSQLLTPSEHSSGLRLLPYGLFIIENKVFGINFTASYLFNIVFLISMGLSIFYFFSFLIHDRIVVFFVATSSILLPAMVANVVWLTGRQSILATAFGFLALGLAARSSKPSFALLIAITIVLFLSTLSKEYGILFSLALPIYALFFKKSALWKLVAVSITAMVLFSISWHSVFADINVPKWSEQGGALNCEMMGHGFERRQICTTADIDDLENLAQIAQNVVAGILNPFFPLHIDYFGSFSKAMLLNAPSNIIGALIVFGSIALISLAVRKNTKVCLFLILIVVLNGVFSATVFRPRNTIPGYVAAFAIYSVGIWYAVEALIWKIHGVRNLQPQHDTPLSFRSRLYGSQLRLSLSISIRRAVTIILLGLLIFIFAMEAARSVLRRGVSRAQPLSHCFLLDESIWRIDHRIFSSLLAEHGRSLEDCPKDAVNQ